MSSIKIYRNCPPTSGGDIVLYSSSPANAGRRLVFVNGIWNTPADHATACNNLCTKTSCDVIGVYNQFGIGLSAGDYCFEEKLCRKAFDGVFDIGQSASDWVGVGLRALAGQLGLDSIVSRIGLMNGCSARLLSLLRKYGSCWPNTPLCIVAHSQGNLITSNALMVYSAMARTYKFPQAKIHVFAVASPAVSWPTDPVNISVDPYLHRWDPVTAVSMFRNMRGIDKGQGSVTDLSMQHELKSYLDDRKLVNAICAKVGTTSPFLKK